MADEFYVGLVPFSLNCSVSLLMVSLRRCESTCSLKLSASG